MSRAEIDPDREERIDMNIIVDAYNEEERRIGWHCYLDNCWDEPFQARLITKGNRRNPQKWQQVEVLGMASEEDCRRDMLAEIRLQEGDLEDVLTAPLVDLDPLDANDTIQQAIGDWQYWCDRDYVW